MTDHDIVCPFCPLCCDDVAVTTAEHSVAVGFRNGGHAPAAETQCALAESQFRAALTPHPVRVAEQTFDFDRWDSLVGEMDWPVRPAVSISHASIEEAKQLNQMHSRSRIRLATSSTPSDAALDLAYQREGTVTATLGDVIRHADLIWIVGDVDSVTPRLRDRLAKSSAKIVSTNAITIELLSLMQRQIVEGSSEEDSDRSETESIVRAVDGSRYLAIVLGSSPFESGREVICSEWLMRWLVDQNDKTIRSDDGGQTVARRAVLVRWSSGPNLQAVFHWHQNRPVSPLLSAPRGADICLGQPVAGQDADPVRLQIGGVDPGPQRAHAYIPASQPGVHLPGTTIRGDGAVTLPLIACAEAKLPSRIEVLRRVLDFIRADSP